MAEIRIPIIVENKGKKALADTDKGVKGLSKSFKKLAGAAGIALSTQAVINFGKNAAKAFIENEKSAKRLEGVVRNLGLALSNPLIESNLDSISAKYGYQGEVLRESYQKLLTSTGSLEKSQDLLNLSLNISAGTGQDLVSVNQDLAALYVGNTKGLKKYNLGLSAAQLKTIKYEDAVALLNKQFAGAAQDELGTYAGKMRVLGEASDNAQEIIGGGLIDALMIISGDTSIDGLSRSMQDFAEQTAEALKEFAAFKRSISDSAIGKALSEMTMDLLTGQNYGEIFGLTPYSGSSFNPEGGRAKGTARRFFGGGQDSILEAKRNRERIAADAEATKRAKERAKLENKSKEDARKKAALEKAARTLELQQIGIAAALKGNISETDRLSLNLQLALLDKNDTQAAKLSGELTAAVKRQNELNAALLATPEAPNPYRNWKAPDMGSMTMQSTAGGGFIPDFNVPANSFSQVGPMGGLGAGVIAGVNPQINVVVTLDGDVVTGAITETQVNQSLSGTFSDVSRYNGRGAPSIK